MSLGDLQPGLFIKPFLLFFYLFLTTHLLGQIALGRHCAGFAGTPPWHTPSSGHGGCYRFSHMFMGYWSQIQSKREQINTQELLLLLPTSCSLDIPPPWTFLRGDSRAGAVGGNGTALTLQPDTVTQTHHIVCHTEQKRIGGQGQGGDEEPGSVSTS